MHEAGSNAWVLPIADSMQVAIGEYEMIHIITEWIKFNSVPHTPDYCNLTLVWQGNLVPVFDIYNFIYQSELVRDVKSMDVYFVCIVAYSSVQHTDAVEYGAVLLSELPYRTIVTDDLFCDYPSGQDNWSDISTSCFQDKDHGAIPIIDLQKIFGSSLSLNQVERV